jgi:branched-chain amino acid transport system substrate-binding protein
MHVRRSGTGFGILGTLLLVLAACGGGSSSQSSTAPIMIGVIQPFSGSISYYGTWTMDAVNLVLKQKGDTINGHKIQFIQEDDQCTPGPAVTAAEKLIGRVVAVLGPDCSGDMAAVEPVLKNAQIPHLCPCYLASLSQQNDNYFFREGPSDGPMLQVLIDYMKAQGVNKVAMLTDTTGYGQGERDAFLAGLTKDGMNPPALDLTFDVSTTDFSGQIGRILSAKVDAVLMGSYEDTEGLIAKQARQLGLTVPFYAGSAAAESTFW